MKTLIIFLVTTVTLFAQTENLTLIDHSVDWTGYGAIGGYSLNGTLNIKNASFELDQFGNPIKGEIVFDMTTMAHDNQQLIEHLKSEDFFYVRKHKTAIFTIEQISETHLIGQLTMRGVTNKISVPCNTKKSESGMIISGKTEIDRTKFGINYNSNSFFKNLGSQAIKDKFTVAFNLVLK
ncbi:YceI family protein [Croceivirga thetidis]|uniref:YceI family protein n=1 Tax=Croceivirga thetidis TaxID=2721623 RepID=A0ABX1GSM8_9FLAO|nr:YceI family protein [Croceivirga thetidis]NKI31767.1 YceI family protein [Croceivirga thetidis]